jgi:hypothetical protein
MVWLLHTDLSLIFWSLMEDMTYLYDFQPWGLPKGLVECFFISQK